MITGKYKLLDLFCCQGGAAKGYHDSGLFDVVGVDIEPQPRYPYKFVQYDAMQYVYKYGHRFDFIHASPPCQKFTKARKLQGNTHPDLIPETRRLLKLIGKPYVIENVPGAPLYSPTMLCGTMFGLKTYRHRLFESNFKIESPAHREHEESSVKMGRPIPEGRFMHIVGHFSDVPRGRRVMGMEWANQYGLAQAVPPAYTKWIAKQWYERQEDFQCGHERVDAGNNCSGCGADMDERIEASDFCQIPNPKCAPGEGVVKESLTEDEGVAEPDTHTHGRYIRVKGGGFYCAQCDRHLGRLPAIRASKPKKGGRR